MKAGSLSFLIISLFFSLQALAQDISINVLSFTRATAKDKTRVSKAVSLLGKVINSAEFQNQLLTMNYSINGETFSGFAQTDKTPEAILESIVAAEENFSGGSKGSMDLYMDMYYEKCTPDNCVVGYTSPTDRYFHMNRYLHQDFTPAKTTGNIFHEWLHKIGHGHSYENNAERPHSVPYKLGYLVAKMSAEVLYKEDPTKQHLFEEEFLEMLNQPCTH